MFFPHYLLLLCVFRKHPQPLASNTLASLLSPDPYLLCKRPSKYLYISKFEYPLRVPRDIRLKHESNCHNLQLDFHSQNWELNSEIELNRGFCATICAYSQHEFTFFTISFQRHRSSDCFHSFQAFPSIIAGQSLHTMSGVLAHLDSPNQLLAWSTRGASLCYWALLIPLLSLQFNRSCL